MIEKVSEISNPGTAPFRRFFVVLAFVFLLVFGTTAVITFLLPETYASTVRIKVEPYTGSASQEGTRTRFGVYDPYLIQTEFEILKSTAVLGEAAERLNLRTKWSGPHKASEKLPMAGTVQKLMSRIELRPVRNTSLIEIRAFSKDPNEAAALANAIADVYHETRVEENRRLSLRGINILEQRCNEQEQRIREAQHEVDELRKNLGISGSAAADDSSSQTLHAEAVRQLHAQLIVAESFLAKEKITLEELERLSADQRRDALQIVVGPDNELGTLLVENNLAQQRLLAIQKDHASDHPESRNAARMAAETAKRINERTEGIMIGLRSRVSAAQATAETLREKLSETRKAEIENAERSRPYYDAKLRLEELMRYRSVLNLKLATERIDAELPKGATVEIIDRAVPDSRPVRPNKPMMLFLGAIAGVFVGAILGAAAAKGFSTRRRGMVQPSVA